MLTSSTTARVRIHAHRGVPAVAVAIAVLLAVPACAGDPDPGRADPTTGPTNGPTESADNDNTGFQEIAHHGLILRIPDQWRVHELSYQQIPMDGGSEISDDWLLIQTDPAQECDLDAGPDAGLDAGLDAGIAPGLDYGCTHVMVLGPGSIAVGHGLGQLTEDNPFAFGTNPGLCAEGIAADLPQPDDLAQPAVAREARIGDDAVPYREWSLACLTDLESPELSFHLQRIWYLPEGLVVDNWSTDGLADYLAGSELRP